jgi:hypothetical protein
MVDDLSDWRLASTLNVYEIALLLKGYNPADYADIDPGNWPNEVRRQTYGLQKAIQSAVESDSIEANFARDENGNINWSLASIYLRSVERWMINKNYYSEFLNQSGSSYPSTLSDRHSPYFAPKLAAAVRAWKFVSSNPESLRNKRPKTAIKDWLEANAAELGLVKPDGAFNRTAIDEIAAVANWDQTGGAPATGVPTGLSPASRSNLPQIGKNHREDSQQSPEDFPNLDDDLPF